MRLKKAIILSLFMLCVGVSHAQHIAISNNLLFDAAGALSAGVELPLSKATSIEAYGSVRPWKRGNQSVHKHWSVQTQYRIWPCQVMNGFFFGPYIHAAEFNIGNRDLCFGLLKGLKPNRYEGWLIGGGLGCGYELAIAKHWNIGAEAGIGYTYVNSKKYDCERCGRLKDDDAYNYVGLSRLALSLIYVF
ncbi:MAG: DUF3575 domain-containing protein [Prevotella sp.]|nr:DUF3575 domain-containing protein [Prevotella sp.]